MKKRNISSYVYIFVFSLFVIVVGMLSLVNLVNFYVNDVTDYNEWNSKLGNKFETDEATAFFEKIQFVNINGLMCNVLGQHKMNGITKLNNGYLAGTFEKVPEEELEGYSLRVKEFSDYLETKNIEFVYVATPYTISKYDPQLPRGIGDYGNENIDYFIESLNNNGVNTIDFREVIHNDGINQYDMMYKTDHHWTTKAGFYAYCKLEEYLTDKLNCEVDERIHDLSNYTIENYHNWHLGSNGQRTGIYYAGIDDFDLIVPDFETKIKRYGIDEEECMQDLIYNRNPLANKEYTSRYTYDYVLDKSFTRCENLECKNDKRILIITDSFAKCVNPFLIMGFKEIETIYGLASSMVSKEYIEEYDPDVVIVMYYASFLNNSEAFRFIE